MLAGGNLGMVRSAGIGLARRYSQLTVWTVISLVNKTRSIEKGKVRGKRQVFID